MAEGVVVNPPPPVAHKGRNQQQQRRFGLVEIGDDIVHDAELVVQRRDHNLRRGFQPVQPLALHIPRQLLQRLAARKLRGNVVQLPLPHDPPGIGRPGRADAPRKGRKRFQSTHRGGSHGGDMPPLLQQADHRRTAHLEMLGVHRMPRGVLVLDGQERARPDMERHLLEGESARLHLPDQLGREMQPGGRCGHRTFELRIDCLVARVVDLLALAVQVGRNRNPPEVFEQLPEGHRGRPLETHDALAAVVLDDPCTKVLGAAPAFEIDLHVPLFPLLAVAHDARPCAAARDGERPLVVGRVVRLETEDLDARPGGLVHDDPRPDHLRVVENQQLPGRQHVADVGETLFRDFSAAPDKQLRGAALGEREFGDPLVRKVVIEAADVDMSFHILPEIMRQSYYFL